MTFRLPASLALVALTGSAPASGAEAPAIALPRFAVTLDGAYAAGAGDFRGVRTFREFAEDGRIEADYARQASPGFEVGLRYFFARRLGLAAAYGRVSREGSARYSAALPHPLYLGRNREVSGPVDGLSQVETAAHLDLVYRRPAGRWDFALQAGPSFFHLRSRLVEPLQYEQAYPYETVTVVSVPTTSAEKGAFGFNVGAGLDYRWSKRLGVGALVRYGRAQVALRQGPSDTVKLDAGGVQAAAGLRVVF